MSNDSSPADTAPKEMSFADHLQELRSRLLKAALAVLAGTAAAYAFWKDILLLFTEYPLEGVPVPPQLIYTAPSEAFMLSFKIAFFGGLLLAAPVVLYQAWCFISPGLFLKERKTIIPVVFFSTIFFLGGVLFCYYLVLPLAFAFLLDFYTVDLTAMLSINTYIGFVLKMLGAFGLVFELPIFIFILARLGLVTHRFLIRNIRYAVVIIFVVAAILTPPDILSQSLMAAPLMVLYALSIGVAYFAGRPRV